jgi:hypothetical protein
VAVLTNNATPLSILMIDMQVPLCAVSGPVPFFVHLLPVSGVSNAKPPSGAVQVLMGMDYFDVTLNSPVGPSAAPVVYRTQVGYRDD